MGFMSHSGGSRFGVLADPTLDIVQCSTVVSSTTLVSTISQTQQTVGPDSRHVGPTIDFSHSIHMGPSLEAPLPAGPNHLSTAPSYISSLLPTPILSTSAFTYDYSLHDRLLTIAGPTGSLPLVVDHYAESRSVIDPVYGSSLHDRPAISVGPTSTLAHSEFFDPLLDHMLAAPRTGVCLDDTIDSNPDTSPLLDCRDNVEASIPSISSAVPSDTSCSVQMGTHQ
ncbi:hypothetical protein Fot_03517 [Forsythia ovata]|uniref:CRIB domain-containing protein n=1 Tax=Forsythia ovata TaxID=205694 RepID=A0ABD1X9X2_9LAMI